MLGVDLRRRSESTAASADVQAGGFAARLALAWADEQASIHEIRCGSPKA